jgi:hypothetical protein
MRLLLAAVVSPQPVMLISAHARPQSRATILILLAAICLLVTALPETAAAGRVIDATRAGAAGDGTTTATAVAQVVELKGDAGASRSEVVCDARIEGGQLLTPSPPAGPRITGAAFVKVKP